MLKTAANIYIIFHVVKMERDRDLAEQLRSWALDEMRFRPQGRHVNASVPSKDDFKM